MKAEAIILNTFDDLEQEVADAISAKLPVLYTIGPLSMLHQHLSFSNLDSIESSLWEEDTESLRWLDTREPKSVLYVNFGSLIRMTQEQVREFAWGLANSKCPFLWAIRPDLVDHGEEIKFALSADDKFMDEVRDRGLFVGWCPQERVLRHESIGGFLTHCGWNSTMESISEGVPVICWPFFADQQTNCFYLCSKWGLGIEIDGAVKRERVEWVVREMIEGEKGKGMRGKAMEWKRKAEIATRLGGSSYDNFERLIKLLAGGRGVND